MRFLETTELQSFANNHGGIYKGWVEGKTTFKITRGEIPYLVMRRVLIVVWEYRYVT